MQYETRFKDNGGSIGLRAAQYVRMSTDHQKYSTENQADTIAAYAAQRNIAIVRTYADEGRSGLTIARRDGLQKLINDVQLGQADFGCVLVYDVSRWGRFQNVDESAYYEFICWRAGINVHYCADEFENDGSLASTVLKTVKRVAAADYSRQLSKRVFFGQCRIVTLGFFRGGFASYGLRRQMLDAGGAPKAILERGQRKSLQTDRIILRPGPRSEIETVERIFTSFVNEKKLGTEIAAQLNADRITSPYGKQWSAGTIHKMLENETYLGHNVFNRTSFKLQQKHVDNPPDMWVRRDNAFEGIISTKVFAKAQKILARRRYRMSDEEALDRLAALWRRKGRLSDKIISAAKGVPSSSNYIARFGSLAVAYRLIGLQFTRRCYRAEAGPQIRAVVDQAVKEILANVEGFGGSAAFNEQDRLLTIDQRQKVSIRVARPISEGGSRAQRFRMVRSLCAGSDLTLVIRLDASKSKALDYYLVPTRRLAQSRDRGLRMSDRVFAESHRFDSLYAFYRFCTEQSSVW